MGKDWKLERIGDRKAWNKAVWTSLQGGLEGMRERERGISYITVAIDVL